MPDMEDDEFGSDIPDEDMIDAYNCSSQTLPPLSGSPEGKRRRSRDATLSRDSEDDDEEKEKSKKKKYKIHHDGRAVPDVKILGATQAEALLDSSPYRIRGPVFVKPRPVPSKQAVFSATPKRHIQRTLSFQRQSSDVSLQVQSGDRLLQRTASNVSNISRASNNDNFSHELEDLPSDAFSSPEAGPQPPPLFVGSSPPLDSRSRAAPRQQRLVAPTTGLKQTTLFGGRATQEAPVSASQARKVHNYLVDRPPEAPTHHALDQHALETWVYPTNIGSFRDYQYSIVHHGLFHNLLVALPTGLGKTFIAATIMYNFFRWTKDAQIVFVAPTKPLVAQQVDACFHIVGIPRSQTTLLTGEQPPSLRSEEWQGKRVFFMTPQTLHNDLASGIADPKRIVLLVVDEAHRATGNYAYVKVVNMLRRFNKSFRVLALTATPGATVEAVQEVIDNLEISKVEIRTEESIDIQPFVHRTDIDQIVLEPSEEIIMIKDLLSKALQPLMNQLCAQNAYYNKDPMALTTYGMMTARANWMKSDAGRRANPGFKGMMNALFTVLSSVAHSIKLLSFHGIGPFYSAIKDFQQSNDGAKKPSKYKTQVTQHPDFKKMMDHISLWLRKDDFMGHPKLTELSDTVLNHFMDAGEGRLGEDAPPSSTRVIVFSGYRDSAESINKVLNRHGPMIRAAVFVGQADSKRSEGMNQAKQLETINDFKSGKLNVIVATSIGEEGLDIGQVDLIVCYDASASPIRMLQRMGRTGRKRKGHVVLLLMRGKEEDQWTKAKDNYEQIQKMISSGARFKFRHDLSVRILPRDVNPVVDKRIIDIPIENTQGPALPEPTRRAARTKKKAAKKFHMPDGVETGFQKASNISDGGVLPALGASVTRGKTAKKEPSIELAPIIAVESVFLSPSDERKLEENYQSISGEDFQEVTMPEMTVQTVYQRSLGPAVDVPHGEFTKRCIGVFNKLGSACIGDRYLKPYGSQEPPRDFLKPSMLVEDDDEGTHTPKPPRAVKPAKLPKAPKRPKAAARPGKKAKRKQAQQSALTQDMESEGEESGETQSEGEGDDLRHTSEPSEEEDSDIGSLQDFLASSSFAAKNNDDDDDDDDEEDFDGTPKAPSPRIRSSTTPSASSPRPKPFFVPTSFTQDSNDDNDDDDLPDIEQVVGANWKSVAGSFDSGREVDKDVVPVPVRKKRRRKTIEDSDEDE